MESTREEALRWASCDPGFDHSFDAPADAIIPSAQYVPEELTEALPPSKRSSQRPIGSASPRRFMTLAGLFRSSFRSGPIEVDDDAGKAPAVARASGLFLPVETLANSAMRLVSDPRGRSRKSTASRPHRPYSTCNKTRQTKTLTTTPPPPGRLAASDQIRS